MFYFSIAYDNQRQYIGDEAYKAKLKDWIHWLQSGEKSIWDYESENDDALFETDEDGDEDVYVLFERGVHLYEPDGFTQQIVDQYTDPSSSYWEVLMKNNEWSEEGRQVLIKGLQNELDGLASPFDSLNFPFR